MGKIRENGAKKNALGISSVLCAILCIVSLALPFVSGKFGNVTPAVGLFDLEGDMLMLNILSATITVALVATVMVFCFIDLFSNKNIKKIATAFCIAVKVFAVLGLFITMLTVGYYKTHHANFGIGEGGIMLPLFAILSAVFFLINRDKQSD